MSLFLHGCPNLVFILFLRHGEGLSREPYCDSLFIWDLFFSSTWQRAKPRTLHYGFYNSFWFWNLLDGIYGLDGPLGVQHLIR